MTRKWLPIIMILLGGWVLLEALSYQAGLGNYAQSPQRLQLSQGLTAIVGGGRAGLVFVEDRFRKRAQILVRCEDGRNTIQLRPGQVSDELCGVTVELLEIMTGGKVNVVVRWGPESEQTDRVDPDAVPPDAPQAEAATTDTAQPVTDTETEPTEGENK